MVFSMQFRLASLYTDLVVCSAESPDPCSEHVSAWNPSSLDSRLIFAADTGVVPSALVDFWHPGYQFVGYLH